MSSKSALTTLLWSESVIPCGTDYEIRANHYSPSPALIARVESDWDAFLDRLPADFDPEDAWRGMSFTPGWDAWDQLAHDWILTRNHHGAGFWDGDWIEPIGDHLTVLAHQSGELHVLLCDSEIHPAACVGIALFNPTEQKARAEAPALTAQQRYEVMQRLRQDYKDFEACVAISRKNPTVHCETD